MAIKKAYLRAAGPVFANLENKTPSCVLPISVGQPYHEDAQLGATIHLVNKKFSRCTIVVGDILQRFTYIPH